MIIVVDFDGTLAIGDTSDLENMTPNSSIVKLVNDLYNDGNVINIVTARGSKSCSSIEEKEKKYFNKITNWLKKYNINYNSISFNKEYGDIYLDDKCFNVNDNIIYQKLDTNFTGNKVRRINNIVTKKTETSVNEFNWFTKAKQLGINVPEVLSYDIDSIATEFIDGKNCENFDLIQSTINILKNTNPTNTSNYHSYIKRIENHIKNNKSIINGDKLIENLKNINPPNTFNHGDFSIYNIIEQNNNLFLIDPIYSNDLFQSYYLDIAKHLFSVLFYKFDYKLYDEFYKKYIDLFYLDGNIIDILIASESVRVANKNNKFYDVSNNLIDNLK
jgi:tRNA A-37 threonylcarbamoyl transferase component Bud32